MTLKITRHLLAAGMLLALAACTSTGGNSTADDLGVNPNEAGNTGDPAAGFANAGPGSEEDFILNVGRRVFFTSGSAELDSVARATLDNQAAFLTKYPRWLVKLQGFADDPGSSAANVTLSQKRADAAMAYLASKGIDPKRMWTKGYGNDRAVRECNETSCKVQNRRVVVNLQTQYES
jgi:peptidoglycan-associated lipoprotein